MSARGMSGSHEGTVYPVEGNHFRAVCSGCGWQTIKADKGDADIALHDHIEKHSLRDPEGKKL